MRITKLNELVKHLRLYDLRVAQENYTVFKSTSNLTESFKQNAQTGTYKLRQSADPDLTQS